MEQNKIKKKKIKKLDLKTTGLRSQRVNDIPKKYKNQQKKKPKPYSLKTAQQNSEFLG